MNQEMWSLGMESLAIGILASLGVVAFLYGVTAFAEMISGWFDQ